MTQIDDQSRLFSSIGFEDTLQHQQQQDGVYQGQQSRLQQAIFQQNDDLKQDNMTQQVDQLAGKPAGRVAGCSRSGFGLNNGFGGFLGNNISNGCSNRIPPVAVIPPPVNIFNPTLPVPIEVPVPVSVPVPVGVPVGVGAVGVGAVGVGAVGVGAVGVGFDGCAPGFGFGFGGGFGVF